MQPSDIGTLIRSRRQEKKMTQKELAEQLHVTDKAVSKWERGICYPDISLLADIAKILDITLTDFFSQNSFQELSEPQEPPKQSHTPDKQANKNETIIINSLDYARQIQKKNRKKWRLIGFLFMMFPVICGLLLFTGRCRRSDSGGNCRRFLLPRHMT